MRIRADLGDGPRGKPQSQSVNNHQTFPSSRLPVPSLLHRPLPPPGCVYRLLTPMGASPATPCADVMLDASPATPCAEVMLGATPATPCPELTLGAIPPRPCAEVTPNALVFAHRGTPAGHRQAPHRLDGVITELTAPAGCVMGLRASWRRGTSRKSVSLGDDARGRRLTSRPSPTKEIDGHLQYPHHRPALRAMAPKAAMKFQANF
jgi:hypothetical protein